LILLRLFFERKDKPLNMKPCELDPVLVKELERRLRVSDVVLKFLTVRIDETLKRLDKRKKERDKRAAKRALNAPATPVPAQPSLAQQMTEPPAAGPVPGAPLPGLPKEA
jgi:small subunit ribosomal protein S6